MPLVELDPTEDDVEIRDHREQQRKNGLGTEIDHRRRIAPVAGMEKAQPERRSFPAFRRQRKLCLARQVDDALRPLRFGGLSSEACSVRKASNLCFARPGANGNKIINAAAVTLTKMIAA